MIRNDDHDDRNSRLDGLDANDNRHESHLNAIPNERTPLVAPIPSSSSSRSSTPARPTPLPWRQLSILLFLQLAEPLTSQVIYPFAPQLIREVGITNHDEAKVGYYVGLLQSAFFATQAVTVLQWSRLSDSVGRKPVLLIGLLGISLSMYCFGLSRTYWGLVISRSLNGALNGNIGIMKSMMAEFTDSTNVAQAFAYMPIAWCTGGTLGPLIGGSLSRPVERFPWIFDRLGTVVKTFMERFPYFLACAVPATFALFAMVVAWVFLEETVPNAITLSLPSLLPARLLTLTSKRSPSPNPSDKRPPTPPPATRPTQPPLKSLLTTRVLTATLSYALLSLVDIAYRGIQPIFLSTPPKLGGLGWDPAMIGICLACFGVLNGIAQVFLFPRFCARLGPKRLYLISIIAGGFVFATFPLMTVVVSLEGSRHDFDPHFGEVGNVVLSIVAAQTLLYILFNMAYSCVFIYVAASSPSRHSIGATNGIAQMVVSIMRTIGPSFANSLYSYSISRRREREGNGDGWDWREGLVWVAMFGLVGGAFAGGTMLPRRVWRREGEEEESAGDEEA